MPLTERPICVGTLPLTMLTPSPVRPQGCWLHWAEPLGSSGFSLSAIRPSTHWCLPAQASLPPAWTHAVDSSLPDSILWPPGSQRDLCEPHLTASFSCSGPFYGSPLPSGHATKIHLLPQSQPRLVPPLIFPELTARHLPPALCFLLLDCVSGSFSSLTTQSLVFSFRKPSLSPSQPRSP